MFAARQLIWGRKTKMGIKMKNKRTSARRAATFLAAIGVLVLSSGVALMVTATSASAAKNPVNVCHATGSDSNPYVFIVVDDDSIWSTKKHEWRGHGTHRADPNKTWKSAGTFEGVHHDAGAPKPDFIGSFTDDDGVFHAMDGNITAASCDDIPATDHPTATVDVDFDNPTCDDPSSGSVTVTTSHASVVINPDQASYSIGQSVTVTATAAEGAAFEDGATTVFNHTFQASDAPCKTFTPPVPVVVNPPVVNPPKKPQHHHAANSPAVSSPSAVTPTVVHAGLASATVQDVRGEQGLALMVAGMVMLVGAGGLRLRASVRAPRI
jgi:hypothetical protein